MADSQPTTNIVRYKEVPGFPAYRVGDDGSAWTRWRRVGFSSYEIGDEWKLLKTTPDRRGRVRIRLSGKQYFLYRLVLEVFIGSCPEGMCCRHLDGNSMNNRLENLAWGTSSENSQDALRHGTHTGPKNRGKRRSFKVLTAAQVQQIRTLFAAGAKRRDLASRFNVCETTIWYTVNRRRARAGMRMPE